MRLSLRLLALLAAGWLAAQAADPPATYAERRRALAAERADGPIVLFGYREGEGQSGSEPFRQENNFYYLTGVNEPGAALLLQAGDGERPYRETLFLPPTSPHEAEWNGPRPDPSSAAAARLYGFAALRPASELPRAVERAARNARKLYTVIPPATPLERRRLIPDRTTDLVDWAPDAEPDNILPAVARMRLVKTAEEIERIEKAVEASVDAHLAAWERLAPGLFEYQLLAPMAAAMIDRGALRMAYPPIVGSGPNSVILHYQLNGRPIQAGELLLADVGGEYEHYAADLTRTVPVDGRFRPRQREIYEIVLDVQQAVIDAVRPGVRLDGPGDSLTALARRRFRKAGKGLDDRFLHAVGHHVGLDVHDPSGGGAALEPGMVITVEPGLYLPEEGFGVRIEDVVAVTEDGARVLSGRLPKDPDEIERRLEAFATARRATRRP